MTQSRTETLEDDDFGLGLAGVLSMVLPRGLGSPLGRRSDRELDSR